MAIAVRIRYGWRRPNRQARPAVAGKTWLRSLKVVSLEYLPDGSIETIGADR
jgi:hypothetical protein